jgi:hypothetical protein
MLLDKYMWEISIYPVGTIIYSVPILSNSSKNDGIHASWINQR